MAEMDHGDAVDMFQSITGADAATAEHVLEAHAWDLTRGINFFMEGGTAVPAAPADRGEQNGLGTRHGESISYYFAVLPSTCSNRCCNDLCISTCVPRRASQKSASIHEKTSRMLFLHVSVISRMCLFRGSCES